MSASGWLQFTGHQPKRRRAELACVACHSKKVGCSLTLNMECSTRPSRRGRPSRSRTQNTPLTPPDSNSSNQAFSSHHNSAASETRTQIALPCDQVGFSNIVGDLSGLEKDNNEVDLSQDMLERSSSSAHDGNLERGGFHRTRWSNHATYHEMAEAQRRPAVANDSPSTQRTEDHSEHNDSYPVGHVFLPELQTNARDQERLIAERQPKAPTLPDSSLQQAFAETYLEYCYPWCPVLERDEIHQELARSPLLANALAVVGSHVQPPMVPHEGPAVYYDRARARFYNDEELDVMTSLKAISLFYWWSPRPPTILHRHSSWWWTCVVIRHCQQLGVHREPALDHPLRQQVDLSLRRRVWWTAFARERLTALCQNKPCVIDSEDCTLSEPTLDDFSSTHDKTKAEVFIYWVRLCAIIGRIAKYMSRTSDSESCIFPTHLARELIRWVQSLPPHLQLPIESCCTTSFNRDVHQLHLPYLAAIIIIHLKRSLTSHLLPQAYPPAILAATCMARIMRDILSRGGTRFLMAISGWYCGTAFISLLQALRIESLAKSANEDLDILTLAVDQLRKMWPTAAVFYSGFGRLRHNAAAPEFDSQRPPTGQELGIGDRTMYMEMTDGIDWTAYFPFATSQTSEVASRLLVPQMEGLFFDDDAFVDTMLQFQDLFEPCDTLSETNFFL
ncbi:hypothetical protein N7474_007748 [Penicillium riverlandense]|uniref:uncharacterized protein n=1 Tax=Penicillium riverlandense TaxID=1903569 RepID=UPI002549971E|nr:uncharacterized protein N7474_007748 [Penicillium riverlandense]KAJ5811447.1 hypothetical protein N7474_007748 [Penicillium riverlandense]